jgi:ABC-type sulfate/molybdate transport systems ATPase subunit
MTQLKFDNASVEPAFLDGSFENGTYCFTGFEAGRAPDTATRILAAIAGLRPPERGKITIDGVAPDSAPALRRAIGSLFATEAALPAGSVADGMDALLQLRGTPHTAAVECLRVVGATHLHPRLAETLSADERRGVALALALASERPRVLALDSPLAINCVDTGRVRERLRSLKGQCVIVIITASHRDYADLGALEVRLRDNRMLYPQPAAQANHPQNSDIAFSAAPISGALEFDLVTSDAARLAAALLNDPDFKHVEVLAAQRLRGTASCRTAAARLLEHALSQGVQLLAVRTQPSAATPTAVTRDAVALSQSEVGSSSNSAYSGSFPAPNEQKQP